MFLLVFAAALWARLRPRQVWAWIVLVITTIASLWESPLSPVVGIIAGVFGPEIWQGIRRYVRQPKQAAIIVGVLVVIGAIMYAPQLLISLLIIGFVVMALWSMIKKIVK